MFDRIVVEDRSAPVYKTVTERRAPTDESVRLLREMEGAAKAEVIKSLRLDSNTFKGVLHEEPDFMSDSVRYRVIFDLNGVRHEVSESSRRGEPMDEFIVRLRDSVAKEIAFRVLAGLADSRA